MNIIYSIITGIVAVVIVILVVVAILSIKIVLDEVERKYGLLGVLTFVAVLFGSIIGIVIYILTNIVVR